MTILTKGQIEEMEKFYFRSPSKLYFYYTAMNGGKSSTLLQVAHNYRVTNRDNILVMKPKIDSKGDNKISSRVGDIGIECDYLIEDGESITKFLKKRIIQEFLSGNKPIIAILVDESQFLSKRHIEELAYIANIIGIPVLCFGLRTDFRGYLFEGSKRLFELAQKIQELPTRPMSAIGKTHKKGIMNLRKVNGSPTFDGDIVEIDNNASIEYMPVSLYDYLKTQKSIDKFDFGCYNSFTLRDFLAEDNI